MALAYRTICPACGMRLSRRRRSHCGHYSCPHCGVGLRANRKREACLILIAVIAGLPLIPLPSWQFTIGLLLLLGLWCVLYPYVGRYDRTTEGRQCEGCGYDLKGVASDRCPECGGAAEA